jgi:HPt (histidine-containing phosphotransfer) domain-containing protein
MFLQNGFDGFISKPLDSRELNLMLNEFIRNRKPQSVTEAAQREPRAKELMRIAEDSGNLQDAVKAHELKLFLVRDAENAIAVLEKLYPQMHNLDEEGITSYITAVHGMKSALANIGETGLSGTALRLEQAGKGRNFTVMTNETPAFMDSMRSLIIKLKPTEEVDNVEISGKDADYLHENLLKIKTACSELDIDTANETLDLLKRRTWPGHINKVLDDIAIHLLHCAFDEAAEVAGNTIVK